MASVAVQYSLLILYTLAFTYCVILNPCEETGYTVSITSANFGRMFAMPTFFILERMSTDGLP